FRGPFASFELPDVVERAGRLPGSLAGGRAEGGTLGDGYGPPRVARLPNAQAGLGPHAFQACLRVGDAGDDFDTTAVGGLDAHHLQADVPQRQRDEPRRLDVQLLARFGHVVPVATERAVPQVEHAPQARDLATVDAHRLPVQPHFEVQAVGAGG